MLSYSPFNKQHRIAAEGTYFAIKVNLCALRWPDIERPWRTPILHTLPTVMQTFGEAAKKNDSLLMSAHVSQYCREPRRLVGNKHGNKQVYTDAHSEGVWCWSVSRRFFQLCISMFIFDLSQMLLFFLSLLSLRGFGPLICAKTKKWSHPSYATDITA